MALPMVFAAGLWAIAVPLAIKILAGLGIGFVVFQGADQLVSLADSYIMSNFNNLPASMLAIAQMAGFADGLQMILAAYAAQVTIMVTTGALTKVKIS
jgi:hypothetical protein